MDQMEIFLWQDFMEGGGGEALCRTLPTSCHVLERRQLFIRRGAFSVTLKLRRPLRLAVQPQFKI